MSDDSGEFDLKLNVNDLARAARRVKAENDAMKASMRELGVTSDREMNRIARAARSASNEEVRAARASASAAKTAAREKAQASKMAERAHERERREASKHRQEFAGALGGGEFSKALVGGAAMGIATTGISLLTEAIMGAAEAAAHLGEELVSAAFEGSVFAERSTKALELLTGSGGMAVVQFEGLRREAGSLGLDIDETQHSFQRLLAAQLSVGRSRDMIRLGADMQAIGADADEVKRIFLAISHISAKGKLQGRELMMLQMAGVSGGLIFDALAHKLGKSHGEVEKLIHKGKIDANTALDALETAVMHKTHETHLGEAGARFADETMAGMLAQMKSGVKNIAISVGEELQPLFEDVLRYGKDLFNSLASDPETRNFLAFAKNEIEYFRLTMQQNWPEIKSEVIEGFHAMERAARSFAETLQFIMDNAKPIMQVVKVTSAIGGGMGGGIGGLVFGDHSAGGIAKSYFKTLIPAFGILDYAFSGFGKGKPEGDIGVSASATGYAGEGAVAPINEGFASSDAAPEPMHERMVNSGVRAAEGVADGVSQATPEAVEAMRHLADAGQEGFDAEMDSHSPSREMATRGRYAVEGYVGGLDAGGSDVMTASGLMASRSLAGAAGANVGGALGGSRGGPTVGQITLQILLPEGTSAGQAEHLADVLGPRIRREIHTALHSLELEASL